MYNTDLPTRAELPSTGKLLRSTLLAAVIAIALLVTVVLPAEYAIDPTGAGRLLGLTEMGEIKTQLAEEAELDQANEEAAAVQASPSATPQESASDNQPTAAQQASDVEPEQVASLVPDQEMVQPEASVALAEALAAEEAASQATEEAATWGDEVSFTLTPGEGTEYKLTMEEGAVATFAWVSDGGPLNFDTHGDGNGNSISYEKGRGVPEDEGELEAAFTGNHGWFFRNRNDNDVTVVLRVGGDYGELNKVL
jgi:cytoskeletal protein RodZ